MIFFLTGIGQLQQQPSRDPAEEQNSSRIIIQNDHC